MGERSSLLDWTWPFLSIAIPTSGGKCKIKIPPSPLLNRIELPAFGLWCLTFLRIHIISAVQAFALLYPYIQYCVLWDTWDAVWRSFKVFFLCWMNKPHMLYNLVYGDLHIQRSSRPFPSTTRRKKSESWRSRLRLLKLWNKPCHACNSLKSLWSLVKIHDNVSVLPPVTRIHSKGRRWRIEKEKVKKIGDNLWQSPPWHHCIGLHWMPLGDRLGSIQPNTGRGWRWGGRRPTGNQSAWTARQPKSQISKQPVSQSSVPSLPMMYIRPMIL